MMSYTLHFFDDVNDDIRSAKEWYRQQKKGLEKQFVLEIKKVLLKINQHPASYQIRHRNIRTAVTEIFPYVVHFYIDDNNYQVVIIAVLHQSRNPIIHHNR